MRDVHLPSKACAAVDALEAVVVQAGEDVVKAIKLFETIQSRSGALSSPSKLNRTEQRIPSHVAATQDGQPYYIVPRPHRASGGARFDVSS
jgi:hypothetical protein